MIPMVDVRRFAAFGLFPVILVLSADQGQAQKLVPVRIERWLQVQQIQGQVTYQQGATSRPARVGDRLQAIGDGIITRPKSGTTLLVDTGIGLIDVLENSRFTIETLGLASDNGRVTRLRVNQGQVKLRLRAFNHRGSRLDILTPAGVSAVRGTEFGLVVHPSGKTALATRSGRVETSAQNTTIMVPAGFQNFTIPGEPPTPPVPLRDSTELRYRLERVIERGQRTIQIMGQVDPVNIVLVGEAPQSTDRNGQFAVTVPLLTRPLPLRITVITPLGRQQVYDLALT